MAQDLFRRWSGKFPMLPENGLYRPPVCARQRKQLTGVQYGMSIAEGRPQTSSPFASLNPFAVTVADDPVSRGLHESARKMIGIALFSGVINLLMLSGSLYMLQVYDRVIPSRNVATLLGLS